MLVIQIFKVKEGSKVKCINYSCCLMNSPLSVTSSIFLLIFWEIRGCVVFNTLETTKSTLQIKHLGNTKNT